MDVEEVEQRYDCSRRLELIVVVSTMAMSSPTIKVEGHKLESSLLGGVSSSTMQELGVRPDGFCT